MICSICGDDINEKGQDNISPISGYPICEDCKDEIMCAECCEGNYGYNLFYVAEYDKILCRDCLVTMAEKSGYIHSSKMYYDEDWNEICSDADTDPIVDYLTDYGLGIQNVKGD